MEEKKPKGQCSFCKNDMQPKIIKSTLMRRDLCVCSIKTCRQQIAACRVPGCDNYARRGKYWDDELCQFCTKKTMNAALKLGVSSLAITIGFIIKHKLKDHYK